MDQTTKQIIHSLAKRQPRERIIRDLSERFRLTRTDAEQLVNEIEKRYQNEINQRHRPFLILAWGGLTLGGLTLVIIGGFVPLPELPFPFGAKWALVPLGLFLSWGGIRKVMRMVQRPQ